MVVWLPSKDQEIILSNFSAEITLQRNRPVLDKEISTSQYAYMTGKLTGDVVLAHKYLLPGAKVK